MANKRRKRPVPGEEESDAEDEERRREQAALARIQARQASEEAGAGEQDGSGSEGEEDPEAAAVMAELERNPASGVARYNNVPAMEALADSMAASRDNLAWVELLDVHGGETEVVDASDDLKREVAFYNHSLRAVRGARDELKAAGEPYRRPDDFFAEMLKSDEHMARVRDKLLFEERKMAIFEQRKNAQESRKFARQVQSAKQAEKSAKKKETLEQIKQFRKRGANNQNNGSAADADAAFERMLEGRGDNKRSAPEAGGRHGNNGKSRKRQRKDAKFGYGGPKRLQKMNDKKSNHPKQADKDFGPHNQRKNKAGANSRAGKASGKRPGKEARARARR